MHLLILGGTVFVGRHIVEAALAAGHRVTLFHRGLHGADLHPQAERLHGDRDADLSVLRGRRFDAVIDTCGYRPEQLLAVVDALGADAIPHYVFISSISAYRGFAPGRAYDETAPLAEGHEGYGALKARCEAAIEAALPGRVARVRPGLIVGPHDPTGRFTYWPQRLRRGGEVLAPGRPERPVQWIDARDLAAWCVLVAERGLTGPFNAVGPSHTMQALLATCQAVAERPSTLHWVDDAALLAAGLAPWTDLPLWLPEADPEFGGMLLADGRRAAAAGLRARPMQDTVRDTLAWVEGEGAGLIPSVATLDPAREAQRLAAWLRRAAPDLKAT